MNLWVDKYKPESLEGILSQHKAIEETTRWLKEWKPGKALLFYGQPGVGKTLLAEVLARHNSWLLVSMNASDTRNAESIEKELGESSKNRTLFHKGKLILIDEVDGISSGDRGGLPAITKIIKESRFPVIVTANDPYIPKLQTLRGYCILVRFSKVNVLSVEKKLRGICEREGTEVKGDVLKNLAKWSSGDLRSAITDLQTVCQDKKEISDKDLEILGFRERGSNIFEVLPKLLKSKNINAAKRAIQECDKDPDDIFWWVENNLHQEFEHPEHLAEAFNLLSKADVYRSRVTTQQNWRFKLIMTDLLACISLAGDSPHKFIPYQPPQRLLMLGRTKHRRANLDVLCNRLGIYLHSSRKVVKKSYLPYLRVILKKMKKGYETEQGIELNEEEVKIILAK